MVEVVQPLFITAPLSTMLLNLTNKVGGEVSSVSLLRWTKALIGISHFVSENRTTSSRVKSFDCPYLSAIGSLIPVDSHINVKCIPNMYVFLLLM